MNTNTKMKKSFSDKAISQNEKKINMATKIMRRSISDKTLSRNKNGNNNRFLIIINVFGSAGPIKFVVNEEDNAAAVIQTALKMYARQGRLPILGSDANNFFLYSLNTEFDALEACEAIGSRGLRNFVLCKKDCKTHMTEGRSRMIDRKGCGWMAWFHKSLSLKTLSHLTLSGAFRIY